MNSANKKTFLLIIITVGCILIFSHFQINNRQDDTVTVEVADTKETTSIDPSLIMSADNNYTTAADSEITLPDSYSIDVPYISQYPELPTGCEITSLTEVLQFYGFDVDKEYMAANYLPTKDYLEPGSYINYFYGSPWSEHGSGCFSPAIITAANTFLQDNNSPLSANSLSYSSVNTIFNELTKGHPIIIWTCFNYDAEVTYIDIDVGNGQTFSWPTNEHCTVLTGFNLNTSTVTLADPTYGIIERSIEEFSYYYKMYFYQALVIK